MEDNSKTLEQLMSELQGEVNSLMSEIITEALDELTKQYEAWQKAKLATPDEKHLAKLKLSLIKAARTWMKEKAK